MILKNIIDEIESVYPLYIQESYDNSGLIIGDRNADITGILVALDLDVEVINEAISQNCNLIITHHPFIFHNIKKLIAGNDVYDLLQLIIKNNVNIYACHTPMDKSSYGLNIAVAEKMNLQNIKILKPETNLLFKLVTFCPHDYADKVREALFEAGAGVIGNYDSCSYNIQGTGTFRAGENTNPFVGEKNKLHYEPETRIETIFPKWLTNDIVAALISNHPYEEVAYDIYPLENVHPQIGLGAIGELKNSMELFDFLSMIKKSFSLPIIRYSRIDNNKKINTIAICTGSGIELLQEAIHQNADVFLTADIKYHDFQAANNKILLVDIDHYKSEIIFIEKMYDFLSKKFSNFAIQKFEKSNSYIKYF